MTDPNHQHCFLKATPSPTHPDLTRLWALGPCPAQGQSWVGLTGVGDLDPRVAPLGHTAAQDPGGGPRLGARRRPVSLLERRGMPGDVAGAGRPSHNGLGSPGRPSSLHALQINFPEHKRTSCSLRKMCESTRMEKNESQL